MSWIIGSTLRRLAPDGQVRSYSPPSLDRPWVTALLTAAAYFAASRYMVELNDPVNLGAGFWPGAGITTAALLLSRRRVWPLILLAVGMAEFVNDMTFDYGLVPSLWWSVGNVVEPLLAATLICRLRADGFRSVRDTTLFVLAAIAASVFGGAVGANGTIAWGADQPYLLIAAKWAVGDGLGILTLTPAAVMVFSRRLSARGVLRPEGIAGLSVVVIVSYLAFHSWGGPWDMVLPYMILPPLLWVAARIGFAGTALATFAVAQIANAATAYRHGPFAEFLGGGQEAIVLLQIFVGIVVVTTLILASRTTEAEHHEAVALAEARRADRGHALTEFAGTALAALDVATVLDAARRVLPIVAENDGAELHTTDRPAAADPAATGSTLAGGLGTSTPFVVSLPATHDPAQVDVAKLHMLISLVESACRRIDAEAGLTSSVDDLRSAVSARDRLVSVASHELRTPLTPILGFSELLLARGEGLSPEERTSVEVIQRNAEHLTGVIDDLLTLSRDRAGNLRCEPHPLDVATAARELTGDLGYSDVAIERRVVAPPIAFADAGHFAQILTNLLVNAERYGRRPVTIEIDRDGIGQIRVTVTDEGPGVDPSFVPHLFDEFTQKNQSDVRGSSGLGLGLAIARSLARANAGDLTYRPGDPQGSRFELLLPSFRAASRPATDPSPDVAYQLAVAGDLWTGS